MGKEKNKRLLDGHKSQCDKRAKEIVCEENSSRYTACNKNEFFVRKYQIDGDVISSDDKELRCDYMILNDDTKKVYLIELKASKVKHGVEQLDNTEKMFRNELKGYTFYKRLVFSGKSATHGIISSELRRWQERGGKVASVWCNIFKRSPMKEDI